ncbi:recombinase XerC, partial [Pseudomonas sp. GW460-C3]
PMASAKRLADADERAGEDRETWILVRDAAVMALLYGSGLRISEALGLKRREVPKPGEGDVLVVTGKGNKTRMVPVLQNVLALVQDYVSMCPHT